MKRDSTRSERGLLGSDPLYTFNSCSMASFTGGDTALFNSYGSMKMWYVNDRHEGKDGEEAHG